MDGGSDALDDLPPCPQKTTQTRPPLVLFSPRMRWTPYAKWAQSVQIFICGRVKLGYLTGESVEPEITDPKHQLWRAEITDPCQGHLDVVYRILKYLKQASRKGLCFKKTKDRTIKAFTDAD
ncbi:hypothetical protein LIER_30018 [Lithospermum erythrorhizon]|uniref:Uncharacterized protein n=1 Tax=Lithospermum erythrorhizon TaxID=34254 RepID=A0AAV3RPF5_LITER